MRDDQNGCEVRVHGTKFDIGKIPVMRGALQYFPRALVAVAEVSQLGANKYIWGGWRTVPDGFARYSDALGRHLLAEASSMYDLGPGGIGTLHAAQVAWNALARLELLLDAMAANQNGDVGANGACMPQGGL